MRIEQRKRMLLEQLRKQNPHPYIHDLRQRSRGHNIERTANEQYAAWTTPRLRNGDIILTEKGKYVAFDVDPLNDPPDMVWAKFVDLKYIGWHEPDRTLFQRDGKRWCVRLKLRETSAWSWKRLSGPWVTIQCGRLILQLERLRDAVAA